MAPYSPTHWHLFCCVIDNFGDIGVAWRLAKQLDQRGQGVTLWVDDASALAWMAPESQGQVVLRNWPGTIDPEAWPAQNSVVVEMFGCDLPTVVQQRIAQHQQRLVWLNLEYLSAESYVQRSHGLRSPVMSGPAAGRDKWFYYPGFTEKTGGLLREDDLLAHQQRFDRHAWRQTISACAAPNHADETWLSLFCYEPPGLKAMLNSLEARQRLLVTPGRAQKAVAAEVEQDWPHNWQALTTVSQEAFDHMLWACDLNFVRGEDSLVRALWAGQALIWHIYPQEDDAHHDKLMAFLDWVDGPEDWRQAHLIWNGLSTGDWPTLHAERIRNWQSAILSARQRLLAQADLCTQLMAFCASRPESAI